jgi:phage terminase large subunit GpA-like protein
LIVPWSSVGYEARDLWSARQAGADPQGVVNLRSALPYRPRVEVAGALEAASVQSRLNGIPRGVCPVGTERVTAFVDVGARRLHWAVTAWRPGAVGYVIDYGVQQVHGPDADYSSLTVEQQQAYELALAAALRVLAERWSPGWPVAESPATARLGLALVDMGYSRSTETVYRHCVGRIGWCAAKGWTGERGARERFVPLRPPAAAKRAGAAVAWRTDDGTMWAAGDRWFLRRPPDGRALVTADVDHWKIWVHEAFRLHRAPDAPQPAGSLSLYGSDPDVHVELARHITAEQQVERVDTAGRMYLIWERISRDNHWLDALVGCRVAAEVLGVRADDDVPTAGTTRPAPQPPQSETSAARQPVVPLVRPARPVRMSRDGFGGG